MPLALGIETSCDECSVSVLEYRLDPNGQPVLPFHVRSLATFSQISLHQPFGGVVPEVASRNHLETFNSVLAQALSEAGITLPEVEFIAVTQRPGLVGALLVGVSGAKTLAYLYNKPLVPVHHLLGHCASVFLAPVPAVPGPEHYPALLAVVSGGHTQLHIAHAPPQQWPADFLKSSLIGQSRDDAAGEAFDKTAKLLGFPYPGGMWIDKYSDGGNPGAFPLPVALKNEATFDFSFSGLKTAVRLLIEKTAKAGQLEEKKADLCASIQASIIDALFGRITLAQKKWQTKSLWLVGGVSANRYLRKTLAAKVTVPVFFPDRAYSTDNAAMIAAAGILEFHQGRSLAKKDFVHLNAKAAAEY